MSIIRRISVMSATFTGLVLLLPVLVSAHVIVTPSQVGIGQEPVFNISNPNEGTTSIVKLTLNIPAGVTDVVPTERNGWTISTTTNDSTTDPEITSITWSGGQVPVAEREDFGFSAQVPGQATQLDWKAYQTYADGTVVHWDQRPTGSDDATGNVGPYSVTKVVNDLTAKPPTSNQNNSLALIVAVVALVVSVGSWLRTKPSQR